jgi:Flp pilus assembly protein TadD
MFLKRLFNFIPKSEFSKALGMFNTGQHRKALKKFEEMRAVSGRHADVDASTLDLYTCEAHVALSKEYAAVGNLDDAIREMQAAVAIKPMFADLHYNLGKYQVQKGSLDEAEKSFRSSLDVNNKFFRARVHLAYILHQRDRGTDAAAELMASKLSCPNFYRDILDDLMHILRAGEPAPQTEELFHELLEERPSSAQISKELAIEAIQNGDNEEAIRELKKAIALKPDYPDLHNYLGIAYGNNGMVDDAVQEFEIALKINPYYLKARLNLALLYYENDRYVEAQAQLDEVLAIQPDNQLANNLLSELKALADEK